MNPYMLKTLGHMLNDTALTAPVQVVTIAMVRGASQKKFLDVKELPDSVPVLALTQEQQDVDVFDAPDKNKPCMPMENEDGTIERLGMCDEKMEGDTIVYTKDGDLCFVLNSDTIGLYGHHCSLVEAVNMAGVGDCSTPPTNECTLSRSTEGPSTTNAQASSAKQLLTFLPLALTLVRFTM